MAPVEKRAMIDSIGSTSSKNFFTSASVFSGTAGAGGGSPIAIPSALDTTAVDASAKSNIATIPSLTEGVPADSILEGEIVEYTVEAISYNKWVPAGTWTEHRNDGAEAPLPVQMRAAPTVTVSAGAFKFNISGVDFYQDGNIDKIAGVDSGYGAIFSKSAACFILAPPQKFMRVWLLAQA